MPNYKEMYFELFRATEKAVNILIEAQREGEERYILSQKPFRPVPVPGNGKKDMDKK